MRKLLLVLTFALITISLTAQDKIYFNDSSTVEAKILTVSKDNITYKKFDNIEGPTYEMDLTEINMIIYQNGTHQMFNNEVKKNTPNVTRNTDFRKNRINADLLAIGENGPTSISYERLNKSGALGIEVPFSVYFNADGIVGYTGGVNLKFYLTHKRGKGLYIGPSVGIGVFDWYSDDYYYSRAESEFSTYVGGKMGYQFQVSKLFGINLAANGGTISNFEDYDFGYSLNLGINFSF